jgi:copper resistance protein C
MSLRTLLSLVAAVLIATIAGAVVAPPATAHASQKESEPAANAVLDSMPTEVAVTFDSALMDVGAALVVRDASGGDLTSGPAIVERNRISVPLRADATSGRVRVAYRVVSQDGHAIEATFDFTVEGAATASTPDPSPAPTPTVATPTTPTTPTSVASEPPRSSAEDGSNLLLGAITVLVAAGIVASIVALVVRRR